MDNKTLKSLEKIKDYLILGIIFLFPLTFANSFIDQLGLPKLIILGLLGSLVVLIAAIQIYFAGSLNIGRGRFDLGVLVIIASYLVSGILVTPNKMEAFFLPGTASFVIGLGILYFLINSINNQSQVKKALILSGVFMSLLILASFLGVFNQIPQLPTFVKSANFNPAGDFVTSSIYLGVAGILALWALIKESKLVDRLSFAFALVFILIAFGVSIFNVITPPGKNKIVLPPYKTSWDVAVDTIKENPLLGIGPGNYLTAFNRFRPVTYNNYDFWQIRFSNARNWYLTVLTETGLLGGIGIILIFFMIYKIFEERRSISFDPVLVGILIAFLSVMFFFPATATTLFLLMVILALNSNAKLYKVNLEGQSLQAVRLILSILIFGLIFYLGFKARPVILAEARFKEANDALITNDSKKVYSSLTDAITLNPWADRYHAAYSQVNLAIARAIISNVKDPKDLTDKDKNDITQLIQQAIREGQNTVSLNPTRAANWQVLANIYQIIIPYAPKADSLAIQAYNQTINLDPTDPNLRVTLGGLYYSLGQYDNAITTLQFAILSKQDFANAYYNIALSYAAKNDFNNAILAMNKVLSIVPKDSNDYKLAQNDLENLQKKQKTLQDTSSSTTLTTPTKNTTINPIVKLPEASPAATTAPIATGTPKPTLNP